jgi:endoglucanase
MMSSAVVGPGGRLAPLVLLWSLLAWGLVAGTAPADAAEDGDGQSDGRAAQGGGEANPFGGERLYVDPASHARREAAAARDAGDEDRARLFDRLGGHAQADWIGDWYPTAKVRQVVDDRLDEIAAAGAYPVLVLYAIPMRDCGSHSGGGFGSSQAYLEWVHEVAAGIAERPAAVVLEPDSLTLMDCLSDEQRAERLATLREAVRILGHGEVAVYVDAGHSDWHSVSVMAERLRAAGIDEARGFALNVSNFQWTDDELAYGRGLSERVGGAHFVVDTSRNGQGPHPEGEWCNPSGRGLGLAPRVSDTGDPRADALLWIKRPGESDGECGRGEPQADRWWPEYALDLAAARQEDPAADRQACPEGVPSAGFEDTRGSAHEGVIDCMAHWGITQGVGPQTFAPGRDVRRDQIATFLYRVLDVGDLLPETAPRRGFDDVPDGHAHQVEIETLAGLQVIDGTGSGRFSPDRSATRGQMASLIVRMHEEVVGERMAESQRGFSDIEGSPHETSVRKLVTLDVTRGYDDGTFRPAAPVTRAQMAAFVMRYVDHLVREDLVEPPES